MNRICRRLMIFALLTGGLLVAVAAYPAPYVELYSDRTHFLVGDAFDVQVVARSVTDVDPDWGQDVVLGFSFEVHYPRGGLSFAGIAMGPGLEDISSLFPDATVAGIAPPGVDLFGEKTLLASLNFDCLSVGEFILGIASAPGDKNGGLLTWLYQQDIVARLKVNVHPVPEPLSLVLLAGGLAGIGLCRRIRRGTHVDAG